MRMSMAVSAAVALTALAACTAPPPTVSYRVVGGEISDANAANTRAMQYCEQQYGRPARIVSYDGKIALYQCGGTVTAGVPASPVSPAPSTPPAYRGY